MSQDWKDRFAGYRVNQQINPAGELVSETHCYGMLEIGLVASYHQGKKTREMYFLKGKPITRKKYEVARTAYAEMPPSDDSLEDQVVELRRVLAQERRETTKRLKSHVPNPDSARRLDSFCANLCAGEDCEDMAAWIEKPTSTLGELSRRASRDLVQSLFEKGALRIVACRIDRSFKRENSGDLVIVLPEKGEGRKSILDIAGKWAIKLGFEASPDDGQTMVYIKLD